MTFVQVTSTIGIMFIGYVIGRLAERVLIGSWDKPKEKKK